MTLAETLLAEFCAHGKRYLWTDAFAVCTCLELERITDRREWRERALSLVDQVHHVLGRHRPDASRRGWISGLSETEGELHPTRGGLRIGKPLPERSANEPEADDEWDRDGQYFHYATKWMLALDRVARATRDDRYARWAVELAVAAHRGFVYGEPGRRRMWWKASIDLSRPLVTSMGLHDPLDGYVTCCELGTPTLAAIELDYASMMVRDRFATADPLGLGGLLLDAARLDAVARDHDTARRMALVDELLRGALVGLAQYVLRGELRRPAHQRLAFRELGLAIGLAVVPQIATSGDARRPLVRELERLAPVGEQIVAFWSEPSHRANETWAAHADINSVMLATSLLPQAMLRRDR